MEVKNYGHILAEGLEQKGLKFVDFGIYDGDDFSVVVSWSQDVYKCLIRCNGSMIEEHYHKGFVSFVNEDGDRLGLMYTIETEYDVKYFLENVYALWESVQELELMIENNLGV